MPKPPLPVRIIEHLTHATGARTWQVESAFVLFCLAMVAIARIVLTGHGWIEWIGVIAVWATFSHASVANRLEEQEERRSTMTGQSAVACHRWLSRYYYAKEICWFVYFTLIGAYSALVGVLIFLSYGWWRKTWRRYHPVRA